MKQAIPWEKWRTKGLDFLKRYKLVLLVLAAGFLFLLWPAGNKQETAAVSASECLSEEDFSVSALEGRLETILSKIKGAGDVSVMLTVQGGSRRILAEDEKLSYDNASLSKSERATVLISAGSSAGEKPLLIQQLYPRFQGALVVCEGGDDPAVRLRLMEAVSALTGLGADKITICKGKG